MVKNSPAMQETWGSIPLSERTLGEANGYPLQYSCLENSIDREARRAIVHVIAESDTTEQPTLHFHHSIVYTSIHSSF